MLPGVYSVIVPAPSVVVVVDEVWPQARGVMAANPMLSNNFFI